jgi:hypothetical protein
MDDHTMQDSSSEAALIPGPDDDVEMTQDDRPVKLEDLFNSDDENELAALPAAVQHETGITPSSPIAPPPPVQYGSVCYCCPCIPARYRVLSSSS